MPADGIDLAGRKILIIDDVLATGGTVAATVRLLGKAGAVVTGAAVLLELSALDGRAEAPRTACHQSLRGVRDILEKGSTRQEVW